MLQILLKLTLFMSNDGHFTVDRKTFHSVKNFCRYDDMYIGVAVLRTWCILN